MGLRRDAVPQHQQMPMAAFRIQGATWPVARAESGPVRSGAVSGQFKFFLHLHRSNYQFYHSNKAYGKRIEKVTNKITTPTKSDQQNYHIDSV